jgi:hypothetical protein
LQNRKERIINLDIEIIKVLQVSTLLIFYGNQIKKTTIIIIVLSTLNCVNKISTPFPTKKDAM